MIGTGKKIFHKTVRLTESELGYIESFAVFSDEYSGSSFSEAFSNMVYTFANNEPLRKKNEKLINEVKELEKKKASILTEIEKLDSVANELQDVTKHIYKATNKKVKEMKKAIDNIGTC